MLGGKKKTRAAKPSWVLLLPRTAHPTGATTGWVTAPYCHPGTSWKDAGPEKELKWSNTQHILTPQLCTARRKAAQGQEAAPKGGEGETGEPRGAAGRWLAAQASPHHLLQLPCPQIRGFWGLLSFLEGFPPAERHPLSPHTASRAGDIPLKPRAGGTCPRGEHPGVPPPSPVGAP